MSVTDPHETAAEPMPVTVVLTRQVRPGQQASSEALLARLAAQAVQFPGHQGVTVLRPEPGGTPVYTIVVHFRSEPELAAWTGSPDRARLLAEAEELSAGGREVQQLSGLEGWFQLPGQPIIVPPPRYKTPAVTWLAILPLLIIVNLVVAPALAPLPLALRPVPVSVTMIALLTWIIMPLMTRAFRCWLYPPIPAQTRRPRSSNGTRASNKAATDEITGAKAVPAPGATARLTRVIVA